MNNTEDILILGIESSCDDTSCAVLKNNIILSNVTANQSVHRQYGGVIPELASRDHEKNIIPVIDAALKNAKVNLSDINAIAVTRGPGLSGSLLVGLSAAKSLSLALNIPLIEVNHMQGHILAHFILEQETEGSEQLVVGSGQRTTDNKQAKIDNALSTVPSFPFLCLTVSGGHTQIVKITSPLEFELLAETEDDAVGEAFDKAAKIIGLPYPGGPLIDKYAQLGDATKYKFPTPKLASNNYSFSGVKTAFLYFIQEQVKHDPDFVKNNLNDICASYQAHLIRYLLKNLLAVAKETNIIHIAIAGGVSANSGLRKELQVLGKKQQWHTYIPKFEYCTDNAAMIGIAGYYKFLKKEFCGLDTVPLARYHI
jgi:N6-L-threonylcarbamoyladenine synthase